MERYGFFGVFMKNSIVFFISLLFLFTSATYSQILYDNVNSIHEELLKAPNNSEIYYTMMKYYAINNQRIRATDWLEKLLRSGFNNIDRVYNDTNLANVIGYKNFINLMRDKKKSLKESIQISKSRIQTKLETEYKYSFGAQENNGQKKYLYKYATNGYLSEKVLYNDEGKENWKWRYLYDKNNNITDINEYNSANKLSKSTKYRFDERYNLLSVTQTENKKVNFVYEFLYDKYDNMIKASCNDNNYKKSVLPELFGNDSNVKIIFDTFGNIIDRAVFTDFNNVDIQERIITTINGIGRPVENKKYGPRGELKFVTKFVEEDKAFVGDGTGKLVYRKYDDYNNLILEKETGTLPDGTMFATYIQEYDKNGNIIFNEQTQQSRLMNRNTYLYDNRSNLLEEKMETSGALIIQKNKYDNDLLLEHYNYMESYSSHQVVEQKTKIEYNSTDDILKGYYYDTLTHQNFYDKDNNLIESLMYNGSEPTNSIKYTYTYYK
jgi:hypothetical protein